MPSYLLREAQRGDETALNALYRRLTGIRRSGVQYAWEWWESPLGPSPSWVVIDEDCDRLVAHHGVVPVPLRYDGRELRGGRTENTMLDPDYRGRLIYHAYEARILNQIADRFDVLFTTSGKSAWGAVRRRLGYRPVAGWRTFTLGATAAYLARRALGRLVPVPTRLPLPRRDRSGSRIEETTDLDRVAAAAATSARRRLVEVAGGAAYLKWRLVDHPYHHYTLAMLTRAGRDEGSIAWRTEPNRGGTVDVHVENFCVPDCDPDRLAFWLAAVVRHWRRRPARILFRTIDTGPYAAAARRVAPAWLNRGDDSGAASLMARADDEIVAAPWLVTTLLGQGI